MIEVWCRLFNMVAHLHLQGCNCKINKKEYKFGIHMPSKTISLQSNNKLTKMFIYLILSILVLVEVSFI